MMSRLYSATFAARAFARCRATYRDICLNRSDIRDWRARPRAARARRRSTSLTCRDICLESSDICPLSRGCGRAACGTARCRSTCRDICLDSSDTPRLSSGCGRAALGIAPCRSTCRDFCRVRVRFVSCRVATFAEIYSTKDIDICRKFNDIIGPPKWWGFRYARLTGDLVRLTRCKSARLSPTVLKSGRSRRKSPSQRGEPYLFARLSDCR